MFLDALPQDRHHNNPTTELSITKVTFTRRHAHLTHKDGQWHGYRIDVRVNGKRYRDTFPSRTAANEFINRLRAEKQYLRAGIPITNGNAPHISELFAKRITLIQNPKEIVRAVRVFDYFGSLLDFDMRVPAIKSFHFQLFINARVKDGMKPETINREMTLLSTAFHRASEMFPQALEDYEPPKIVRPRFKQKRRERVITEKENKAILEHLYAASVRIARMWEISWLLGLAYAEVAHLLKTEYKERTLRTIRQKTGAELFFAYLPDEACKVIEAAIADSDTDYVFTISGSTPKHFYKILKKAVESVGMKWGRDGADSITFHSLRHSFVSRLIQVTDLATAKTFTGHSDETLVALYSHASEDSKKRAMDALYGHGNLRQIYDKVAAGEMDFEDFTAALN